MFNLIKRQKASTTVALSTSAALVLPADNNRGRVIIRNTHGSVAVFVGNSDVSSSTGIKIAAGDNIALFSRGKIYAIAASSTPSIEMTVETTRGNDIKSMKVSTPTPADTATKILNRDNKRMRAIIQNVGSSSITVGNSAISAGSGGIVLAQNKSVELHGTEAIYASGPGTNEIQNITITGTPSGGNYKLTFGGQTTGTIAHNASASDMQTALRALSSIGSTGCSVSGTSPYAITFTGPLANTDVPLLVVTDSALTGGTAPAATPTEATKGASTTYATHLVILTESL